MAKLPTRPAEAGFTLLEVVVALTLLGLLCASAFGVFAAGLRASRAATNYTTNIAAELGEAPAGSDHYRVLFLTGTLLFLITFAVNLTADFVVRGIRRK